LDIFKKNYLEQLLKKKNAGRTTDSLWPMLFMVAMEVFKPVVFYGKTGWGNPRHY
jgi:hypothetical protein